MSEFTKVKDAFPHADAGSLFKALSSIVLSPPGLAIGTGSAAKVKIANTVVYTVNGVFCSKTTAEVDLGTADSNNNVLPSKKCLFAIALEADGTPSSIQSAIVASTADDPDLPATPADQIIIGYCKVVTDDVTTFNPGTTLLSAAGVTDTYVDLLNGVTWDGSSDWS